MLMFVVCRVCYETGSHGVGTEVSDQKSRVRLTSSWMVRDCEGLKDSACFHSRDCVIGVQEVLVPHFVLRT